MTKEPVTSQSAPSVSVRLPLPLELELLSQDVAALARAKQERLDDIWTQAITQRDRLKVSKMCLWLGFELNRLSSLRFYLGMPCVVEIPM